MEIVSSKFQIQEKRSLRVAYVNTSSVGTIKLEIQ